MLKVNPQAPLEDRACDTEKLVQPLQPKEGAAWPTPNRWKEAVKDQLEKLHWNQTDLAREVSKYVETTPAAISYVLTKAKQSSLRPYIEKVIGWTNEYQDIDWDAERKKFSADPTFQKAVEDAFDATRAIIGGPERRDLVQIFESLAEPYRSQLLAEARYLHGLQELEQTRQRDREVAVARREDVRRRMEETYVRAGKVSALRDATDAALADAVRREDEARARLAELHRRHLIREKDLADAERKLAESKTHQDKTQRLVARATANMTAKEVNVAESATAAAAAHRAQLESQVATLRGEQSALGTAIMGVAKEFADATEAVERETLRLGDVRRRRAEIGIDGDENPGDE